ncbi:MAG: hypothetical protein AAF938_09420 [Myxococcota bacterium]
MLHVIPGIMTIDRALSADVSSIAFLFPETNPHALMQDYPREAAAISVTYGQHGFNLLWFGLVALVGSGVIAIAPSRLALILSAVVIGLADLGALFATWMIGRVDVLGVLIFSGTALGTGLTVFALMAKPPKQTPAPEL